MYICIYIYIYIVYIYIYIYIYQLKQKLVHDTQSVYTPSLVLVEHGSNTNNA